MQRVQCSSILRNACLDKAGPANFFCSKEVNTSNVDNVWQLVAEQYLYSSLGVYLQGQDGQQEDRVYVPEYKNHITINPVSVLQHRTKRIIEAIIALDLYNNFRWVIKSRR